ncbi:hypothetical protein LshimejAT787_0112790 [Lyophyllum shimeji]|uniref:F-box domain-containing protein n=1 Tax=Lyophyllum shimeji TaxID=47721 RepID=A0A9P3PED3_LYOSH|nr:hypothetical protein LshimejAT787_0112790 [Lyophyllum shimeji]
MAQQSLNRYIKTFTSPLKLVTLWDTKHDCRHLKCKRLRNERVPPISRLPVEVLCMIFEIVYLEPDPYWPDLPLTWTEITLSHVSAHWRRTALHMPLLWSRIFVGWTHAAASTEAYLKRSGRRPLSIIINFVAKAALTRPKFRAIWHRLMREMSRWRFLEIANDEDLYGTLAFLEDASAPLLEEIEINNEEYDALMDVEPTPRRTILRGGAPRLKSIDCWGLIPRNFWPPLSGLTMLQFTYLPEEWPSLQYAEFASLVNALPALTHLSVEGEPVSEYPRDAKLVFPSLLVLRMTGTHGEESDHVPRFWLYATAPLLSTLHLLQYHDSDIQELRNPYGPHPVFPSLASLITEELDWSERMSPGFSAEAFETLATAFPSIKHLMVMNEHDPALTMLSVTDRWPDTMLVSLWGGTNLDMDIFKIQKMLRTRIARGRPIPKLCIANRPPTFPMFFVRNYVALELIKKPVNWGDFFC